MYYIKYECDLFGDHSASIEMLCDVNTKEFLTQTEALSFIEECTSAFTKPWDIVPWLSDNYGMFEEPLNENIKIDMDRNIHLIANGEDFKNLL